MSNFILGVVVGVFVEPFVAVIIRDMATLIMRRKLEKSLSNLEGLLDKYNSTTGYQAESKDIDALRAKSRLN